MSRQDRSYSTLSIFISSVINRGAYAGVLAACNPAITLRQVQSLLEIIGAYTGNELYLVLVLYIFYKVGKKAIDRHTGNIMIKDLEWIYTTYNELEKSLGGKAGISFDEIVRKYLGAFKWSFIAVRNTKSYYICREIKRIPPNIHEIIKRLVRQYS